MKTLDYALWALAGVAAGAALKNRMRPQLQVGDLTALATPNDKAAPYVRSRTKAPHAAVLHQMAFSRGNDPMSYLRTTAHYIVLPDGGVYQLYDHSVRLPAADGFNSGSVSIEFAGNLPSKSRSDDPRDWWYPTGKKNSPAYQNQLTAEQVRSGRDLLALLRSQGINVVVAHRQSAEDRPNDPGPDVWGAVGEFAVRELGMSDGGPGYKIDGGNAIPQAWRDAYATWRNVG